MSVHHWLDEEAYTQFRDLILGHTGLYYPDKKRHELEAGVRQALSEAPSHIKSAQAYYQYLRYGATPQARQEMARLINRLTVGETHFFRDSAQFDALARDVLPALIARKRAAAAALDVTPPASPQLRLWSAGCASGEEAYSLAILLHQLIPDIENWRIFILATDINEELLAKGRQAIYSEWSFREERAKASRADYFRPYRQGYQLQPQIRRLVTFTRHNLIEDPFPAVQTHTVFMDLILCRNVTIYFQPEVTRQVAGRFHEALVDGGWLVVGHAEPSATTYQAFTGHILQGTLLYQKAAPRPSPVTPAANGAAVNSPLPSPPPATPEPAPLPPPRRTDLLPSLPASLRPAPQDAYAVARELLSRGQVEKAIAMLEDECQQEAAPAVAQCLLGRAYADLGQWQKARDWCQKAQAADPLLPEVYYVLAMVHEHEGNLEPAIDNLKKVVYLDQDRPLAYFNLAMLYKKRAQVGLARRALQTAIRKIKPWPPDKIIPDSGFTRAGHLAAHAWQLLSDLESEEAADYFE